MGCPRRDTMLGHSVPHKWKAESKVSRPPRNHDNAIKLFTTNARRLPVTEAYATQTRINRGERVRRRGESRLPRWCAEPGRAREGRRNKGIDHDAGVHGRRGQVRWARRNRKECVLALLRTQRTARRTLTSILVLTQTSARVCTQIRLHRGGHIARGFKH